MELLMNKINLYYLASSLVLLAIFFSPHHSSSQIPKLFLKFVEKQGEVKSGFIELQFTYINDGDTSCLHTEESFFISTPRDFKYLSHQQSALKSSFFGKSVYARVALTTWKGSDFFKYSYYDKIADTKNDIDIGSDFSYSTVYDLSNFFCEYCDYQRIIPKLSKKNIRYRIIYPDCEWGSNRISEWEFNRKTFNWIQNEYSITYFEEENIYGKIDILEQRLYDYIHPDILDTISFKFEELKKGYDRQIAEEQAKKDSMYREYLCDSIYELISKNGIKWIDNSLQEQIIQKDTLFFMPEWQFPLLSGDTISSKNINSQFLLIDMWYIACHPCRLAMRELSTIDTLFDETLLKIISLNVSDKDITKIRQVVNNLNLKCDVALAYDSRFDLEMSKQMGNCYGHPQLYLIDMKTRQVIWQACGFYKEFTKDIEEIVKRKK